MNSPRVGFGFDAHAFGVGSGFMLGGVRIPFERGVVAHSDGDVLLHALCDALLGAGALGDLGAHYPDDEQHRDIAGHELLRRTQALLSEAGFAVVNLDATVVVEAPHLAPFIGEMQTFIAARLGISPDSVSIKATSSDGLGFTGRGEGIAAFAVVSVAATR